VYRFDDPRGASSTPRRSRCRVRSPTAWYRRSSSNPSPPFVRCWPLRERASGNREGFDRLRDRCLQQRRLPDHEDWRSRSPGVRFEWGYQGSAQRHRSVVPSPRARCTSTPAPASRSDRSGAIADLCIALPQRTNTDAIGDGVQADPFRPGLRVHPKHHALTVQRRADLLRRL